MTSLLAVLLLGLMFVPALPAQASKQQIDESIKKAVEYLRKEAQTGTHATPSIAAYALMKAGVPPEDETVRSIIEGIVKKTEGGVYKPTSQQYYEAGVDIMVLEASMHETGDDTRYLQEISTIVQYILKGQSPGGSWFYPNQPDTGGDTSITQYAVLGLWAAHRAGVKIPSGVWSNAAAWHLRTQRSHGEFIYHPGGGGGVQSFHSMTTNGIVSLCVARLLLYPKGDYTLPKGVGLLNQVGLPSETKPPAGENGTGAADEGSEAQGGSRGKAKSGSSGNGNGSGGASGSSEGSESGSSSENNGGDKVKPKTPAKPKKRFGILIPVDSSTGERVKEQTPQKAKSASSASAPARAQVALADLNFAIGRSVEWMTVNFKISGADGWLMYYLYGLERCSALADIDKYGDHDWYDEGALFLIGTQLPDGHFPGHLNNIEGTSFALLFLTNATKSLFSPNGTPRIPVGGGLLVGNRGLPENLSEVNMTAEGAQTRKPAGPVDELLAELENPKSLKVEAIQEAVIEKVQLGDREALVGQRDRLIRLAEDPRVEVRRTMLWALGRCSLIIDAPIFLRALEDPDISVVVEANNALCWLSRRPHGVGPSDPLAGLPQDASEEQKLAAVNQWREGVIKGWRGWFATVEPYKDREFSPPPRVQ